MDFSRLKLATPALVSTLAFLTGCAGRYQVTRDVVYTPADWPAPLKADVYQPAATPAPAVLLIHGGGWEGPDRRWQMSGIARKLASRGYVVVNATYRMAPAWSYPAPVEDLGLALDWMRANSAVYGIDSTKIATFGYSAGGHLAALVGLENPRKVKAIVAGGAPSDLGLFGRGPLVIQFLGGEKRATATLYHEASPVHHVSATSPPVFLYHGDADQLVPPQHARKFKSALDRAGVRNELHWLEGRSHAGAFLLPGGSIDKAIDFLDSIMRPPSPR